MGYGQKLRMQRSADVRVLKAQLDLIADVVYDARYVAPIWAVTVAILGSSVLGILGHQPLKLTIILAVAITIVSGASARIVRAYQNQAAGHVSPSRRQPQGCGAGRARGVVSSGLVSFAAGLFGSSPSGRSPIGCVRFNRVRVAP